MMTLKSISSSQNVLGVVELAELIWGNTQNKYLQKTRKLLAEENQIPYFKIGSQYFVKRKDVAAWLECPSGSSRQ